MTDDKAARVALVTGGTNGIGRAIALGLRADGFEVAVMARGQKGLGAMAADGFTPIAGDVADATSVEAAIAAVAARFGRLDALIHCAGVVGSAPLAGMAPEAIRRLVEINLIGTILVNRAAIALLKHARGSIVNFSTGIVQSPMAGTSVYAAAKAGVEGFSRALAFELGPDGVRVNVIVPALVRSNIWLAAGMSKETYERNLATRGAEYPLGRAGEPEDVAGMARFLASPAATWITGAIIPVDGGRALGVVRRSG